MDHVGAVERVALHERIGRLHIAHARMRSAAAVYNQTAAEYGIVDDLVVERALVNFAKYVATVDGAVVGDEIVIRAVIGPEFILNVQFVPNFRLRHLKETVTIFTRTV